MTPSLAATADSPSGITCHFAPFGVPGLNGSAGWRRNIRSTPPWRGSPGRGELKPSEITGVRPSHGGTGHTQRPGSGPANGATGSGLPLDGCDGWELRRVSAYAATPPPMIHGHARISRLLVLAAVARDEEQPDQA